MLISQIPYNGPQYQAMLQLRNEVLRKPLGMELDTSNLGSEINDFLIVAEENEKMIGCVILTPKNDRQLKLRQMAVSQEYHGKGIGSAIIAWAEAFARSKGFSFIEMNARKYAVPFYEKQGYQTIGDEFEEVNIPHLKMTKTLVNN